MAIKPFHSLSIRIISIIMLTIRNGMFRYLWRECCGKWNTIPYGSMDLKGGGYYDLFMQWIKRVNET